MKTIHRLSTLLVAAFTFASCASVDVTKTGKGYYPPTNPNEVEILMTVPTRPYEELASVTTTGYDMREEAKLHNAIRAKAAPLGANAVILKDQGIIPTGMGGGKRWAMGVAIHYTAAPSVSVNRKADSR
jgi:hypothetical protein